MTVPKIKEVPEGIDAHIPALGVRQPWLELILRGEKTIEVRRARTHTRGRIYLYASRMDAQSNEVEKVIRKHQLELAQLPHGLLVGSVEVVNCRPTQKSDARAACASAEQITGYQAWCLENPVRFERPLEVNYLPFGTWFYPYQRVGKSK